LGRTDSSNHNQLYSTENAVGIIVANGHVGPYLDSSSPVGTYLSRDAGQSWIQIAQGSHIFEIANHGAITLFAQDSKDITELKYAPYRQTPCMSLQWLLTRVRCRNSRYSWTQGASHTKCAFTSSPMTLTDIATEPDNKARTFIMYGARNNKVRSFSHTPP
jgi:hypothetical protein